MNPVIKPISIVLKEARQNKGVSLEEAHKATRIHPNILRSLEEGTTLGLSHVYVKSYIKIYAKYLGVSQQELDKYFHPTVSKEKKVSLEVPIKAKGIKIKSLPKLTFLTSLGFQIKKFRKAIFIIVAVAVVLFLLVMLFNRQKIKDAVILGEVSIEEVTPEPQPESAPTKEEKPQQKTEKVVEPSKTESGLKLTIKAKEDTWMQIKKDGEVVFKRILKKANSETWQADENFELWIANAGTIELELNGKALAPLGRRGQLLKSVFITKDGLIIKR